MTETLTLDVNCDRALTPTMLGAGSSVTRGHNLRLYKFRTKYDLHKYYFTFLLVELLMCGIVYLVLLSLWIL